MCFTLYVDDEDLYIEPHYYLTRRSSDQKEHLNVWNCEREQTKNLHVRTLIIKTSNKEKLNVWNCGREQTKILQLRTLIIMKRNKEKLNVWNCGREQTKIIQ